MNGNLDLLLDIHFTGGVFLDARFSAPWCITAQVGPEDCAPFTPQPRHIIAYHLVTKGRMRLALSNDEPISVETGQLVVIPKNDVHTIGSDLTLSPTDVTNLIEPGDNGGIAQIVHGGGGDWTHLLCGFLGNDQPGNALFALLPSVLKLDVTDVATSAWIESSFRFGALTLSGQSSESHRVLARLSELLFMDAVTRYISATQPRQLAWRASQRDPIIGRALGLIHGRIAEDWTTERLAREVGLSRSAFADRFSRLIKVPPMAYLASVRLEKASVKLRESAVPIPRIASAIGYESEAAFSRAFRRVYGVPPGTWRKQAGT
ncbi:cupin domain-containing protein [Marinobacter sp.]|uniref:AraC family transcriptional regulator n=1 Tax=Marinobacter sp. TaxID=50741 RepID=UPI0034A2315F